MHLLLRSWQVGDSVLVSCLLHCQGENADSSALPCGEEGDWDELFVGWPTVINFEQKAFYLYYHSLDPRTKKYAGKEQ